MRVTCPYCDRPAELVNGSVIYPGRQDLVARLFWRCEPCRAWVGCHPSTKSRPQRDRPLGRLANAELRRAKIQAHASFDPMWRSGFMDRSEAYRWLAGQIGVAAQNCHIGMMDVDACRAVIAACESRIK